MLAPILFLAYISNIGEDTLVYVGDTEVKNGVKTWWKKGQEIRAGVPPPPFRSMPERKHFFYILHCCHLSKYGEAYMESMDINKKIKKLCWNFLISQGTETCPATIQTQDMR